MAGPDLGPRGAPVRPDDTLRRDGGRSCAKRGGSILATRPRTSSTAAASASSRVGKPPIYDRAALKLTDDESAQIEAEGRSRTGASALPTESEDAGLIPQPTLISWNDSIRGDQSVDIGSLSDPVLIREDGSFLYMFPSVVDDIDFGITHVIRGDDHVTNSGVQIEFSRRWAPSPPAFGHHSLLIGSDGQALSKRLDRFPSAASRGRLEALAVALSRRSRRHVGCDRAEARRLVALAEASTSPRSRPRPAASTKANSNAQRQDRCTRKALPRSLRA